MTTLIDQIRDALRQSEGMTIAQLADAIGEEHRRVAMTCYEAKGRGVLTIRKEDGGMVYALNTDTAAAKPKTSPMQNVEGAAAVPPPGASSKKPKLERPRKAAPRKRDFFAAAESADKTLKALQFSRQTAADALQVYIHSCVDPEIFGALQSAVHGAQAAIDKFSAGGAE